MLKLIVNVEQGGSFPIPNTNNSMVAYRITTNEGEKYLHYRPSTIPPPEPNQSYELEVLGNVYFKWTDDKENKTYMKVKMTKASKDTTTHNIFQQNSPEQQTPSVRIQEGLEKMYHLEKTPDIEYHKMAMDYLYKIGKLDLVSLSRLAPYMRSVVEGRLSPDKVGELHLQFYPDSPFN